MSGKRKVMNLNSLLIGADDKLNKPASRPNSAFTKPTMNKLSAFETLPKKEESKIFRNIEEKPKPSQNKVTLGLSKLFDKAEEMNKGTDQAGDAIMQPNEFNGIRRPQTASHYKRASKFSQKAMASEDASMESGSQSEYSSSSESDKDMQEETKVSPNVDMERVDTKSPALHKRGKNKKWNRAHIEIVSTSQPTITPQMKKRSIANLQNRNHESSGMSNLKQFQMKRVEFGKGTDKAKPDRKKNLLMTPSQTMMPSRKLLQMKTVGVLNSITTSRVREEHDVQNLKPSSEFFSQDRMTYVNQLREDFQAVKLWKKSFADAINEIKIDSKDILDRINPKFKRRFVQAPGIKTKTIVFGLDGVLVKTNFEKDHDDWKPTTLVLNEDTGAKIKIFVSIRPYVVNTLKQLRRAGAEIILYSTSKYNYTSAILEVLNKQRIEFHHIITAEDHEEALLTSENPSRKIVKSK